MKACASSLRPLQPAAGDRVGGHTVALAVLEEIQKTTEGQGKRLEVIELQNDIERLDRDWEAR